MAQWSLQHRERGYEPDELLLVPDFDEDEASIDAGDDEDLGAVDKGLWL